ncbi:MAG: hypothetical protein R6V58_05875 [Planctomycetota bacterium]
MPARSPEREQLYRQRLALARRQQGGGDILRDPIEDDPNFAGALRDAHELAEKELADHFRTLGFCHVFWKTKQQILREQFDVVWFSPADMNPDVSFD